MTFKQTRSALLFLCASFIHLNSGMAGDGEKNIIDVNEQQGQHQTIDLSTLSTQEIYNGAKDGNREYRDQFIDRIMNCNVPIYLNRRLSLSDFFDLSNIDQLSNKEIMALLMIIYDKNEGAKTEDIPFATSLTETIIKNSSSKDPFAYYNRGHISLYSIGVEENFQEAFKWFIKAAKKGIAGAYEKLGFMYECGFGFEKNSEEAIKCYTEATNLGNVDAALSLDCLLLFRGFDLYRQQIANHGSAFVLIALFSDHLPPKWDV